MIVEDDTITILDDEIPNIFHVISKKVGELGIIFKPNEKNKFCFKQTDLNKYLKTFHIYAIIHELNIKNGVNTNVKRV
jgi:hypothetical protein